MKSSVPKVLRHCLKCDVALIHTKYLCAICSVKYPNLIENSRKEVLKEMELKEAEQ